MMHRKEIWAVLVVVLLGTGMLVYAAARAIGQVLSFQGNNANSALAVETSGWQTYSNNTFGFTVQYPSNWELSTDGLSDPVPFIAIGNPIQGKSTYALDIFIQKNSNSLSSGEYVHQLLAADRAEDVANAKAGPAPRVTPQFTNAEVLNVGMYDAYELYGVFEFDHSAERIYVANGNNILQFDFPIAEENQNISLPVNNNLIAHEIVTTLVLK